LDETSHPPLEAAWRRIPDRVVHVFTHFRLELTIFAAELPREAAAPDKCWWEPAASLPYEALPSIMKKAIEAAIPGASRKSAPRARAVNVGRAA
jgi:A/G-specific adenine glycosylase